MLAELGLGRFRLGTRRLALGDEVGILAGNGFDGIPRCQEFLEAGCPEQNIEEAHASTIAVHRDNAAAQTLLNRLDARLSFLRALFGCIGFRLGLLMRLGCAVVFCRRLVEARLQLIDARGDLVGLRLFFCRRLGECGRRAHNRIAK